MNFSSADRNAFVQRRRPAPDLISRPLYGDLYLAAMWCGHVIFTSESSSWLDCPACRLPDVPMVVMKVRNARR